MNESHSKETGPIYLIGMMGAGKSTVGPALAERLDRAFVDTDHLVEERTGRTISEIFAEHGEAFFRGLEREAIETASAANSVVALGGGAFSQEGAAEALLGRGIVIFLDATTDLILERIGDASSRPLLEGLDAEERGAKLDAIRAQRMDDYAKASFAVSADGSAEAILNRIMERLPNAPKRAMPGGGAHPADCPPKRTQDR